MNKNTLVAKVLAQAVVTGLKEGFDDVNTQIKLVKIKKSVSVKALPEFLVDGNEKVRKAAREKLDETYKG